MITQEEFIIAAKCAPDERILSNIHKAKLKGVELYLNKEWLKQKSLIIRNCLKFPLRYALHAPTDTFCPDDIVELAAELNAEIIVFHDIFWEDEWAKIVEVFQDTQIKICVENIATNVDIIKIVRRFGVNLCLDLEHLQMECGGFYEEASIPIIQQAKHIHMSGYFYSSELWHTHLHYTPKHSHYLLDLIRSTGYQGMIVSEAKSLLQTFEEFQKLNHFFNKWKEYTGHKNTVLSSGTN